jgi:methylthioribose-1-phosphate isomerase
VTRVKTMRWVGDADGYLELLDQTLLPGKVQVMACHDVPAVWEAIQQLRVRGAPAIGVTAAYGLCLGLQQEGLSSPAALRGQLQQDADQLATSRPTAVNLFWALDRMRRVAADCQHEDPLRWREQLLAEARAIEQQDEQMCRAIGRHGASLLEDGQGVLTHCNAGGLATAGYGTALSLFFTAQDEGKSLQVYVGETRPLLQGARLTAWELTRRGIATTLICDSMAAQVMQEGKVQTVVTGADRIAANGDTANKIGTYSLAVLAGAHGIPFYVAAPTNTFDLALAEGGQIPIEQREAAEITHGFGHQTAPDDVQVYNPAFDVTPARLIRAIITERGIIEPVTAENVAGQINA